ncbi:MAG TPA: Holliday junction resolvase RuvX [Acidimicrobiales bacterium]|nr:Holliday junction resolvase RuvX [Acidimicrobiales bacterium]
MGIDLGERRIGIAVSDSRGTLAMPRTTLVRTGDPEADRDALVALVRQEEVARVVVGLPVHLDGRAGPAARAAAAEAEALAHALAADGVAVETFDERLTTVSAQRSLAEAGRRGPGQRAVVDQAAAAVLLQAWLDAHPEARRG